MVWGLDLCFWSLVVGWTSDFLLGPSWWECSCQSRDTPSSLNPKQCPQNGRILVARAARQTLQKLSYKPANTPHQKKRYYIACLYPCYWDCTNECDAIFVCYI